MVLAAGLVALFLPPRAADWSALTWEVLLAADVAGGALPAGFQIGRMARGADNDLHVTVRAPDGSVGAEIHVVPRGCWSGIRETASFGVAYETPRSPAAEREAITAALAARIGAQDSGLPPPDAIPLRAGFDPVVLRTTLNGFAGPLLVLGGALLLALPFVRSPALLAGAATLGIVALGARATGLLHASQATCPPAPVVEIDAGIRLLQVLWVLLIATAPFLVWRAGRRSGLGGGRLLAAVLATALFAAALVATRGDEPLHANAHAWREARQALLPWGGRPTGTDVYLHGRATPALVWLLAVADDAVTGRPNPFAISRIAGAAAVGACALLAALLLNSVTAGLAVGATLALMPLAQTYLVSGSPLAVAAWLLPWSLALLVAAATSSDRVLLAGAALAGALGSQSHTAMLALFPALAILWCVLAVPAVRWSAAAAAAAFIAGTGWLAELLNTARMVTLRSMENPTGLLGSALLGVAHRNLFLDPHWVSPLLVPLAAIGLVASARRYGVWRSAAATLALALVATPFFAVMQGSSDAVRYQGTLLGVVTCLAGCGVWALTAAARLAAPLRAVLRIALLSPLVVLPTASQQAPPDPVVVEHRLVEQATARLPPDAVIVLPRPISGVVGYEFPDFLLPPRARVVVDGDPAIAAHRGAVFFYLGLACISFDDDRAAVSHEMRDECRALRAAGTPWLVTTLTADALPRHLDHDAPWTFHRLATGVPFGFFAAPGPSDANG